MDTISILNERVKVMKCPVCSGVTGKHWRMVKGWNLDKCQSCGMVYANPCPSEKALQIAYALPEKEYDAFFQSNYLDTKKILDGSAEWQYKISEDYLILIERFLGRRGRILDIGCGSGNFLQTAATRGWLTAGVDLGDWCADLERDKELNIKHCSLFDVPFEKGSFDAVYLGSVLEHLQNPQSYIDAIYNLLKPGGIFLITGLPNIKSLTIQIGLDRWIGNHPPLHLLYFSQKTTKLLLKKSGYKQIIVKSYGISETILEKIFNQKKEKYTGSYAGYVYGPSFKGTIIRVIRSLIYGIFNITGTGSVLMAFGRKK